MKIEDLIEKYELEENQIFGVDCYTTDMRVPDSEIPEGWYKYETRMDDDLYDYFGTLEKRVIVNFGCTVISPTEFDLGEAGYLTFPVDDFMPELNEMFKEYETNTIPISDFDITYRGTRIDYVHKNDDGTISFWAGNLDTDKDAEELLPYEDEVNSLIRDIVSFL